MKRTLARVLVLAALCLTVLALALPANTQTLSVCSSGCAFDSLQAAVAAAGKGDVISVGPGVFIGPVQVDRSLTIRGLSPELSVIGGGLVVGGVGLTVRVENLTLTKGLNGLAVLGVANVIVQNAVIAENIADGVLVSDLSTVTLYNTTVANNGSVVVGNPIGAGLSANGAGTIVTSAVTITGNVSAGVTAFGKSRIELGTLTQIVANGTAEGVVPGFGGEGVILAGLSSGTLDAVLVQGNGAAGIAVREAASATIRNAEVVQNRTVGIQIGGPASSNPDVPLAASATVENTKISGNGTYGVLVGDLAKVLDRASATLIGNGITGNGACGVGVEKAGNQVTMKNNFFLANAEGSTCEL